MDATGFPRVASALLLSLVLAQQGNAQPVKAQQDKSPQDSAQPKPKKAPLAPSAAASNVEAMMARYPHGAITSDEVAEQAQVDVQSVRTALATQLADAKAACYDRFFTNSCIDKAQEEYRAAMAALRPIELEAGAFQRQSRVDKRDKALAERRRQEEAEAPERLRVAQENEQKAAQKAQARAQQEAERQARQARDAEREAHPDDRVQRHEEKLKRLREEGARKEQERASNIAAYEEKQREAAERQKKVAERKAEKQAKQAKKQANQAGGQAKEPVQPATPAANKPDASGSAGAAR
jgi:hypothetical protein